MSASTPNLTLPPPPPAPPDWKEEVSARLRAHRTRRTRVPENQPALPGMEPAASAASIAAKVAERYSRVPSWGEVMAAQAAAAAAPPAEPAPPQKTHAQAVAERRAAFVAAPAPAVAVPAPEPEPVPWQPDLIRYSVSSDSLPAPRSTPAQARAESSGSALPRPLITEVVDPVEEALVEPSRPLPARIIEFPRELIAPRKARPRLAEGPLRDESRASATATPALPAVSEPAGSPAASAGSPETAEMEAGVPLRILEADPEPSPAPPVPQASSEAHRPEWHSIHLDAEKPAHDPRPAGPPLADELHIASIEDRAMAGIVDIAITAAAFFLFVLVFAFCSTSFPSGRIAIGGGAVTLFAMWLLYQFLFFTLTDATPGMRYARIALCTFDDENPTRKAMRGRVAALLLSALPLGLGFLWAVFDEDTLGWHDRITRTYQRSYRDF